MASPAAPASPVPAAQTLVEYIKLSQSCVKAACTWGKEQYDIIKNHDALIHKVILIALTCFVLYQGIYTQPLFLLLGILSHFTLKDHIDSTIVEIQKIWKNSKTEGLVLSSGAFLVGIHFHWQIAALGLGYYIAKECIAPHFKKVEDKKDAKAPPPSDVVDGPAAKETV